MILYLSIYLHKVMARNWQMLALMMTTVFASGTGKRKRSWHQLEDTKIWYLSLSGIHLIQTTLYLLEKNTSNSGLKGVIIIYITVLFISLNFKWNRLGLAKHGLMKRTLCIPVISKSLSLLFFLQGCEL